MCWADWNNACKMEFEHKILAKKYEKKYLFCILKISTVKTEVSSYHLSRFPWTTPWLSSAFSWRSQVSSLLLTLFWVPHLDFLYYKDFGVIPHLPYRFGQCFGSGGSVPEFNWPPVSGFRSVILRIRKKFPDPYYFIKIQRKLGKITNF